MRGDGNEKVEVGVRTQDNNRPGLPGAISRNSHGEFAMVHLSPEPQGLRHGFRGNRRIERRRTKQRGKKVS